MECRFCGSEKAVKDNVSGGPICIPCFVQGKLRLPDTSICPEKDEEPAPLYVSDKPPKPKKGGK